MDQDQVQVKLLVVLMVALFCGGQCSRFSRILWYESEPKTWDKAQDHCRSADAELATLLSPFDLDHVDLRDFYAWFGLNEDKGKWKWDDGVDVIEADESEVFLSGKPKGGDDCGMVRFNHTRAYGEKCSHLHFVFCEIYSNGSKNYPFVPETMSWEDGQDLCLELNMTYMDFIYEGEFDWPNRPHHEPQDFPVWIGLSHDDVSWSWSDGSLSEYRSWISGSDPGPGSDSCVAVSSQSGLMSVHLCSDAFPFLCHKQNYSVVLLQEMLSWEQALERCTTLSSTSTSTSFFRLLSLEESEVESVLPYTQGANTTKVWVGLRFLAGSWFWSDGVPVSPSLPSCPDSSLCCGALDLSTSSIEATDCSEKLNLLCYREL